MAFDDANNFLRPEDDNSGAPPPPPPATGAPPPPDVTLDPIQVTAKRPADIQDNSPLTNGGGMAPDGSGGSGMPDWLNNIIGGGNIGGLGVDQAGRLSLLAQAWKEYQDAGKYRTDAEGYADRLDPFGKQRPYYQDRLRQMTEDPNAYLNSSPDYQAALRQGLGARERSQAASGYAGSGTGAADIQQYGGDLAAQYLDRDRKSLMEMAGSSIGPGASGEMLKAGMDNELKMKNNAMTNLFRAMFPETKNNPIDPKTGKPVDYSKDIADLLTKAGFSPEKASELVRNLKAQGYSPEQIKRLLSQGGVDKNDQTIPDGTTTTGPNGEQLVRQNGEWVDQGNPTNGLVDLGNGQGWYDPSTGTYYDDQGNITYDGGGGGGGGGLDDIAVGSGSPYETGGIE